MEKDVVNVMTENASTDILMDMDMYDMSDTTDMTAYEYDPQDDPAIGGDSCQDSGQPAQQDTQQLVTVLQGLDNPDFGAVIRTITGEITKLKRTDTLPMSYSSFEYKMGKFEPAQPVHQWMSVYSTMISQGYEPEMIYTVMELISRVCYTAKPVAPGLKLDKARVPAALVVLYDFVCEALRKNALVASIPSMLTKIGKTDSRMYVITQGIKARIDDLYTSCGGKKTITRDSAELLPLLKPYGIRLRKSITNSRAYDGWEVLDGDKAGDVLEASLSFGINLPADRVDAVLGWAARSNPANIQGEILDGLLDKYKYNGKTDYIQQMADCIPTVEPDSVKVASIRLYLQRMVQVIRNPELQGMVLGFKGKKGCGKSTLAAWLFSCLPDKDGIYPDAPKTVEGLHAMTLSPFYSDQRADFSEAGIEEEVESLSGCFGRELAELSLTQKDWNRFKAAVTSRSQSKRRKYDKYATPLKTIAGMIASMDHISLSEADTHRLLLLTVTEGMMIDLARLCKIPSGMVIAQAVWEVDNGKVYKPDAAMMEAFAQAQLGAVEESSVEAIIESNFYVKCSCKSDTGKELCAVPTADMTAIIRDLLGRDPGKTEITRVLEQHGIKKTVTSHKAYPDKDKVSCWVGVYPTADCILRAVKPDSPLKSRTDKNGGTWYPYDTEMASKPGFTCAEIADREETTETKPVKYADELKEAENAAIRAEIAAQPQTDYGAMWQEIEAKYDAQSAENPKLWNGLPLVN